MSQDWKQRENERFVSKEYQPVPWSAEAWAITHADHFCHISINDEGMIAYTKSPSHGESNRKTRVKPGKYLKTYYSHVLSAEQIARWSSMTKATRENSDGFILLTEQEDCERAYRLGPYSCMSFATAKPAGALHPARVYGLPGDLAIAAITQGERITARAMCWPERKIFYRTIYGDYALSNLLLKAGWKEGMLYGAKINAHKHDEKRFIGPAIDGHVHALRVREEGQVVALLLVDSAAYNQAPQADRVSIGYYGGLTG